MLLGAVLYPHHVRSCPIEMTWEGAASFMLHLRMTALDGLDNQQEESPSYLVPIYPFLGAIIMLHQPAIPTGNLKLGDFKKASTSTSHGDLDHLKTQWHNTKQSWAKCLPRGEKQEKFFTDADSQVCRHRVETRPCTPKPLPTSVRSGKSSRKF